MDDKTARAILDGQNTTQNRVNSLQSEVSELRSDVNSLGSTITRLIRALDSEDETQARRRRNEREEREEKEAAILGKLDEQRQSIENAGKGMRDLPERLLDQVEKKIYELRVARFEALKAGIANEPAPLPPPPTLPMMRRGESTGPIAVHARGEPRDDEQTGIFARQHRDGEPRNIREIIGGVVITGVSKSWKWIVGGGLGGGLVHILHRLHFFGF